MRLCECTASIAVYDLTLETKGVTKRCRLSLLTNSALVYESKRGGRGGVAGSQPMSTAVHITWHGGAQINFGDLPTHLTYAGDDCRLSPASPLVLLPPLNLLTGTCRWSATAVAAAPAMGVRGLSGVREITELGWELMSTCQTKPQVARRCDKSIPTVFR